MIINTNINALKGMNDLRMTGLGMSTRLERLSSGLRINKGADDPSGLAIAKHMEAQIGGIRQATQNAQDGINLIHTGDGVLAETHSVLMRMRDLAIKAANQATLTSSDLTRIGNEMTSLRMELARKSQVVAFNSKKLFTGEFSGGQVLQIGPDNGTNHRLTLDVKAMDLVGLGLQSGATSPWTDGAIYIASVVVGSVQLASSISLAQYAIDYINSAINIVSDTRAYLGIQERRLAYIVNDLSAEDINISASKSRIWDADMAQEITEFTRLQILQQSGTAILGQANSIPQSVLKLLG